METSTETQQPQTNDSDDQTGQERGIGRTPTQELCSVDLARLSDDQLRLYYNDLLDRLAHLEIDFASRSMWNAKGGEPLTPSQERWRMTKIHVAQRLVRSKLIDCAHTARKRGVEILPCAVIMDAIGLAHLTLSLARNGIIHSDHTASARRILDLAGRASPRFW